MLKRCGIAAAAACTTLAAAGPAQAGTTWTAVPSGTTQEITAIDYRSDTQAWLATGGGQILRAEADGSFTVRSSLPLFSYTDIAFRGAGDVGFAVTATGEAFRSADGGTNWSPVTLPRARNSCGALATDTPVPRFNAVVWADATTAYLLGGTAATAPVVIRVRNAGAAPGDFAEANWTPTGCRVGVGGNAVTDGFAVPGAPNGLRFMTESFGGVWSTNDGLATRATMTGAMINNFDDVPRMAVDGSNPSRLWAVDHSGAGCGSLCLTYSEAGGAGRTAMTVAGSPAGIRRDLYDVAFAGGTLVAVGDGGEIYTSVDGKTAYLQRAAGHEGRNWRAVDLGDATHALVGGAGGVLVKSANPDAIPDTAAPTATISGPSSAIAGQPVVFTATVADEAGGSGVDPASLAWTAPGLPGAGGASATFTFATPGPNTVTFAFRDLAGNAATATKSVFVSAARPPVTPPGPPARRRGAGSTPPNASGGTTKASTGGASVAAWKRIALSKGRYVPVRVSASSPRRFVIEIRRAKRPRTRVAMSKARLARGSKLVKVPLRPTVKSGKYRIVVRVYKGRRAIGRRVTLAFVLAR